MEEIHHPSLRRRAPPSSSRARPAKVVSIPVLFVGSEQEKEKNEKPRARPATEEASSESAVAIAAVKIQKIARGLLARRNVRIVRRLEAELEAIERSAKESEIHLRGEEKDRIRLAEELMALLLKLDSVRGARDYRRRVIRRAIALQEAMDAVPAVADEGSEVDRAAESIGSEDLKSATAAGAMERMMEENRALRRVAEELRERNEMQLSAMNGLLGRIERLEKVVEKMSRRQNRRACDSKQSKRKL
ncbi:uncharacterized protein LOC144706965 [Wolffia australiana]